MFRIYITGKKHGSRICKESFLSNRKTEHLIKTDNSHTTKEGQLIDKHIAIDYQTFKSLITHTQKRSLIALSNSKDDEKRYSDLLLVRE